MIVILDEEVEWVVNPPTHIIAIKLMISHPVELSIPYNYTLPLQYYYYQFGQTFAVAD